MNFEDLKYQETLVTLPNVQMVLTSGHFYRRIKDDQLVRLLAIASESNGRLNAVWYFPNKAGLFIESVKKFAAWHTSVDQPH